MSRFLPILALPLVLLACEKGPPEIVSKDPSRGATSPGSPPAGAKAGPVSGPIDLKTAVDGVPGTGALVADLETESGKITCKLFEDKAPKAVANFVGLARGLQPFKDPMSGNWVKRPAYDGSSFHRVMKGFMIQGGDPTGTGMGQPGYEFADELWGGKHDHAGQLCLANTGPNHNGMQFFITDGAADWLDKSYTIFGECSPVETVHKIANTPVNGETPINKPRVLKVSVRRE